MTGVKKIGKLRSPLKWHGGKSYLARKILPLFPSHRVYVEPFIGGGSVLLNKPEAHREVAGDLNAGLINLWKMIQFPESGLTNWLRDTEYSQEQFDWCGRNPNHPMDVIRAHHFLVRNRFSRGGLGKDFAWSDRLRGGQPGDVNAWETIKAEMPRIAERVKGVEFWQGEAVGLIGEFARDPDVLIYADPPYLHETRTAKKAYGEFEMTSHAHRELLESLDSTRGSVVLSGYRSDLYDTLLACWERREFSMPNHSGQGKTKQRRIECVWIKA